MTLIIQKRLLKIATELAQIDETSVINDMYQLIRQCMTDINSIITKLAKVKTYVSDSKKAKIISSLSFSLSMINKELEKF